jgi:hypothetical protein
VTAAIHLSAMSTGDRSLRLEQRDGGWVLAGPDASRFGLVNEYLAHLADRNYSPKTLRSYGMLCRSRHNSSYADAWVMPCLG